MSDEQEPIDWWNLAPAIAVLIVVFVLLYFVSGAPGWPDAWLPGAR
jgi:hypothetical protein